MDQPLIRKDPSPDDQLSKLQQEVSELESVFKDTKQKLDIFEREIRTRLDKEIARIRELTELYKSQKRLKKAKRDEQKRRGKNYKEPRKASLPVRENVPGVRLTETEQKELRRIYKEAVVKFHPDKISHDGSGERIKKATAITAQLNALYNDGDLDALVNFYQYILTPDTAPEQDFVAGPIVDVRARLVSLKRKKETLQGQMNELTGSYIYQVLMSYEDPHSFIEELHLQFQQRIRQLEKRTRTK